MSESTLDSLSKAINVHAILKKLLSSNEPPNESLLARATYLNAQFIWESADGYIVLRENNKITASRLLLRPMIETILWMAATEDHPDLFYRWIYSQLREERKVLFANISTPENQNQISQRYEQTIRDIRSLFEIEHPNAIFGNHEIGLLSALQEAGKKSGKNLERHYHEAYRTYCQYSHATFNSKAGNWEVLHPLDDDYYVFWAQTLALISISNHTKISVPDISFWIEDIKRNAPYRSETV